MILKFFKWLCQILIKRGKTLDLNQNDINDLQEWIDWIDKR